MKTYRRPLLTALFAFALLALSACGGGRNKVNVTTTDFHFNPDQWVVSAGQEITVTLTNNGALRHAWVVIKPGETVTPPFDDDDQDKIYFVIEAQPGETVTGTFTAPSEPGTYTVVCDVLGHLEAGMTGNLNVE